MSDQWTQDDIDHDMGLDDFCPNCGGEGVVHSCQDEIGCVDSESGCDLCERRCDWCQPSKHELKAASNEIEIADGEIERLKALALPSQARSTTENMGE
jgi:hypothetical protein